MCSDATHLLRQYTHAFPILRLTLFLFFPPDSSSLVAPSVTSADSTRFIAGRAGFSQEVAEPEMSAGWRKPKKRSLEEFPRYVTETRDAELRGDYEMYGGEVGS